MTGRKTTIKVLPESLTWARERAGFDISEAARKASITVEHLLELEAGSRDPSAAKVRDLASIYRVSPAAFFLSSAPDETFVGPRDFRSLPDHERNTFSPLLRKVVDRARRQIATMNEMRDAGAVNHPPPRISLTRHDSHEWAAARIREWLNITGDISVKNPFKAWSDAIEMKGILVTQVSRIPMKEMRGFCLIDEDFPIIVINGADAPTAKLFTLLHELVHILLGVDGITNTYNPKSLIETFCNSVAAATLLKKEELLRLDNVRNANLTTWWSMEELDAVSSRFGVSREVLIRRLFSLSRTSQECFTETIEALQIEYDELRRIEKEKRKAEESGGPDYDVMILRDLGRLYVSTVIEARNNGLLSLLDASDRIFSKVRWVNELETRLVKEGVI